MISSKELLSDKTIKALRKQGFKPKLKSKRIRLVPANEEAAELAIALLPNAVIDMSGLPKIMFKDFGYLTRLYQHTEEQLNLRKLLALYDDIRQRLISKSKKSEEPRKKGYVQ